MNLQDKTVPGIDWEMTPDIAFCTYSAKGLREGLANSSTLIRYFFIDNYGDQPQLYLVERGNRYVNILAEIKAPLAMMTDAILNQGCSLAARDNFSVDSALKEWLIAEVVELEDSPFLIPVVKEKPEHEDRGEMLPALGKTGFSGHVIILPTDHCAIDDDQIIQLIQKWNFYDSVLNPQGLFENGLADSGDDLTVIDERTGIMWQWGGQDLCSIRKMTSNIEQLNQDGFGGYHDWRLPTMEEALSLMENKPNAKGTYLNPCFSKEQPFVFVAARRKPTGYWFVDYKQGKTYWSSGTVPGGFSRLCRRLK